MFEYHNQNFNKPTIDTVNGQLKSLGDKFRKVANLKDDNLLTLNDMDGLMDHMQIPTNPNLLVHTKDLNKLGNTSDGRGWVVNQRGFGEILSSNDPMYSNNTIKTGILHTKSTNGINGFLYFDRSNMLRKNHVYTFSFLAQCAGNYENPIPFSLGFYVKDGSNVPLFKTETISSNWVQYCISFRYLRSFGVGDSDRTNYPYIFSTVGSYASHIPGGSYYLANLKLEEGDLATPWCE